jgi:hypothetical protein
VLPAQLKFADIHDLLREELASVLTEPFPQRWTDIIRQLQQATQATNSHDKHNARAPKTNRTSAIE